MARPVAERLAELGIGLPASPVTVAAYAPAVRFGDLVQTSGQLPLVGAELLASGAVCAEANGTDGRGCVDVATARECARICAINALAAAATVIGSLDAVDRIVKITAFVASTPGFTGQAAVADGCSLLLEEVFGDRGRHARSAVGVAALPLGAPVEIDMLLVVGRGSS